MQSMKLNFKARIRSSFKMLSNERITGSIIICSVVGLKLENHTLSSRESKAHL